MNVESPSSLILKARGMNERYFKLSINVDSSPALFLTVENLLDVVTSDVLYGYTGKECFNIQVLIL